MKRLYILLIVFTIHFAHAQTSEDLQRANRLFNKTYYSQAIPLYEKMIAALSKDLGNQVQTGIFGADMKVALINNGPVTIFIDTR